MKNIIKIFRKMFKEDGVNVKKVEVDLTIIERIARRCGFLIEKYENKNAERIRVTKKITQVLSISTSKEKERTVTFACISDIHAGAKGIDVNKLKRFLRKCQKQGIYYLIIAGDLFDGVKMFENHQLLLDEETPEGQAQILFDILKEYDFHVIYINGNHDYSFEVIGNENPNSILKNLMKKEKKKVTYIDSFFGDIVINGIGIHVVHLDDSYGKSREYPCIKYTQEQSLVTKVNDVEYPISIIIAGHIHKHEIHQYRETLILQPGSIKESNSSDDKNENSRIGFIVTLTTEDGFIKEYLIR